MKLSKLIRLLIPLYKGGKGDLHIKLLAILTLLLSASALRAQEKMDSTAVNQKTEQSISNEQSPTTDQKPEGKKSKSKKKKKTIETDSTQQVKGPKAKKGKGSKMDQIVAEKKAEDAAASDSTQTNTKGKKSAKSNSKKPAKPEPVKAEPKIIPGAEAKANAEAKDKEDRTMKGPSGQKVYSSPKGGKYYFDVNGNKKYLRRDNQK